jgi:hypothetical protein
MAMAAARNMSAEMASGCGVINGNAIWLENKYQQ